MSTIRGTARLDERGRLVLPVELRRRLGLNAGDEVAITEEADGALRIESRLAAARGLIGLAGSLDHASLDDLQAVRREQARAEDKAARSVGVRAGDERSRR
jgi:AbrB family looped-hinge helix DNA binding protein